MGYLSQHFFTKFWDSKDEDYKRLYELTRVSKPYGAKATVFVLDTVVQLPTNLDRYHVFSFGYRSLKSLMLPEDTLNNQQTDWLCLSDITSTTVFNVWLDCGIEIPLSHCYVCRTKNDVALLVVKEHNKLLSVKSKTVYFHHYSNSIRTVQTFPSVWNRTDNNITQLDITNHTVNRSVKEQQGGLVYTFINGLFNPNYSTNSAVAGDLLYSYYDSTVYKQYQYNVNQLNVITNAYKDYYVIVSPDKTPVYEAIEDLDFYLVGAKGNVEKGVSLFPIKDYDCVQIINNTYLVSLERVYKTALTLLPFVDEEEVSQLQLYVYYKRSEETKYFFDTKHHLTEFCMLEYTDKQNVLAGDIAYPEDLRAEAWLNSDYARQRVDDPFITDNELVDLYGIYAYSKAAISEAYINSDILHLPEIYRAKVVLLAYDTAGAFKKLTNASQVSTLGLTDDYKFRLFNAALINTEEYVANSTSLLARPHRLYGSDLVVFKEQCSPVELDAFDSNREVIVRYADDFYYQQTSVSEVGGLVTVRLGNDNRLYIPFGYYEVYLNGNKLITDLDYCIDFPFVYIFNKTFSLGNDIVDIVAYGYPNESTDALERGCVNYGLVSYDNTQGLFEDKITNVFVHGKLMTQSVNELGALDTSSTLNHLQYEIVSDTLFIEMFNKDTYATKQEALESEVILKEFYKGKLSVSRDNPISAITQQLTIYSPYLSVIIDDMVENILSNEMCSSSLIYDQLKTDRYLKWKDIDPIMNEHPAVLYCNIRPSYQESVTLTQKQFKVLRQLVQSIPVFNRMDLRTISIEG